MVQYRQETQILVFAITVVLVNIIILYKTFSGLERENAIDPGGTDEVDYHLYPHSIGKYSVFESRLRKLTEISQEKDTERRIQGRIDSSEGHLGCDDIQRITDGRFLSSGWTKAVYSGNFQNRTLAIKKVSEQGRDVSSCIESGHLYEVCYNKAAKKIIREISLLQTLNHNNIIKILGYCIPNSLNYAYGVSMVTELGEMVELIKLLQMSWEDRLKVVYDMTKLLYFMANNDIGSVAINDFRRQQFVLVENTLKLSDVDDIGFGDPTCQTDNDCTIEYPSANFSKRLSCLNFLCVGYNEKRNIFNAGRHFTTFLLPHGAPNKLKPAINRVIIGYSNLTMNSQQLLLLMDKIVLMYRNGYYLERNTGSKKVAYNKMPNRDILSVYDYNCRLSFGGNGCTVSAFDIREAEDLCSEDSACKAFVVTSKKTWTGRTLVHLKSGIGLPLVNTETCVYVKVI